MLRAGFRTQARAYLLARMMVVVIFCIGARLLQQHQPHSNDIRDGLQQEVCAAGGRVAQPPARRHSHARDVTNCAQREIHRAESKC